MTAGWALLFSVPKISDSYVLTLPKGLPVLQPLKSLLYFMCRINKEYCNDQVTLAVSEAEECLLRVRFSLVFCRNNTTPNEIE